MNDEMESWMIGFLKSAKIGCMVDRETVQDFLNIVEPASHQNDYVQCGIPCGHAVDDTFGFKLPLYLTFHYSREYGSWTYDGKCFRGSVINRADIDEMEEKAG